MSWKQALGGFLKSTPMLSMIGGVVATGTYVVYKDYTRLLRMVNTYKCGNILPPLAENNFEVAYFSRPTEEKTISSILNNDFSNEYYLINGEVGVGKTRTMIEIVRQLIVTNGANKKGAPIYIHVSQGKSLPETLAAAVNFNFDEHISFSFFLDFVLRIESFPKKDNESKLIRVLDAIEESSFVYMLKTGKPVVIVIDGINNLVKQMPGALEKLQDKAKLWADANIVKVVFINNDEETEEILQKNSSSWSRAAKPIVFDDMSQEEALKFLIVDRLWETLVEGSSNKDIVMTAKEAQTIVQLVGGRVLDLLIFKRDYSKGCPIAVISEHVKDREREKFIHVSRFPSTWYVISALRQAPNKSMKLSKLIKLTSQEDVYTLVRHNIIRNSFQPFRDLGFAVTTA
ncbi:hypothetical protein HELRODRAFT_165853 [Helobdella robusta]|uniref:AAA+ ATPase domain-containing protein n=1 Tax=Helobdella robusta TaxID=6412 RepID=T1EXD1_HELRO|nr:hypothetical protein HELRODRAFT_165853 [Helobdella robusta]ESN91777.1 hypothetical protein HELRODRAFT_165853 [Helobdella robusta]